MLLQYIFAPFLFPIIVYFLGQDDVKYHAKNLCGRI